MQQWLICHRTGTKFLTVLNIVPAITARPRDEKFCHPAIIRGRAGSHRQNFSLKLKSFCHSLSWGEGRLRSSLFGKIEVGLQ